MTNDSLPAWLAFIEKQHPQTIDMGLDRVRQVALKLDVLKPAPVVVTVAGTNGKGSTAVCLERLLLDAGVVVGATLSPHVKHFNERVRVQGKDASNELLCQCFEDVENAREDISLTYFEYSALVAMLVFTRQNVQVAVLEIGLGGRLDAFNIVDADLAIVTSIGLDHQQYLGSTLTAIGAEKAGIFRADQLIALGSQLPESVISPARLLGSLVRELGEDCQLQEQPQGWSASAAPIDGAEGFDYTRLPYGAFPAHNCLLALAALNLLIAGGLPISMPAQDSVERALNEMTLPGRFQVIDIRGRNLVMDVGHNPLAASYLNERLQRQFSGRRIIAIVGMLQDKDVEGVIDELKMTVAQWIAVGTRGARQQSAAALMDRFPGAVPVQCAASVATALEYAQSCSRSGDIILVFGSFSVVEQMRECLLRA